MRHAALFLTLSACGSQPHWPEEPSTWFGHKGVSTCSTAELPKSPVVIDVKHQGRTRRALAWFPKQSGPWDVVVNLHEFRSNPERQAHYSTWVPWAEQQNVLLIAPDAKSSAWHSSEGCCGRAVEQRIDDVAFLDALMAKVHESGCTSGNVLATGIGQGAMMAERWAANSDEPDAVVSVGGWLATEAPAPRRPIPYVNYRGTEDTFVPADGTPGTLKPEWGTFASRQSAITYWSQRNGVSTFTPQADAHLSCQVAEGAKAFTAICDVRDMIDNWPGAENAPVQSSAPLADATKGPWAQIQAAWAAQ